MGTTFHKSIAIPTPYPNATRFHRSIAMTNTNKAVRMFLTKWQSKRRTAFVFGQIRDTAMMILIARQLSFGKI